VQGDQYARKIFLQDEQGVAQTLDADGTFIEKRLVPVTAFLEGLVELTESGNIKVDVQNRTSVPGIFAAGDVTDSYAEQVLVAVGEGAKAALSAYEYLLPIL
jgi:NADH-dependent peroxiredoxin subunit F